MSNELKKSFKNATGSSVMRRPYQMIEALLNIPMRAAKNGKPDPRLDPRRAALKGAMELLAIHDAIPLRAMLDSKIRPKHKENRKLFEGFGRLASPTRRQMLKILKRTIKKHEAEEKNTKVSRKNFERNLVFAASYLSRVGKFGRAEAEPIKVIRKNWLVVPDREPAGVHGFVEGDFDFMLLLKGDRDPSAALKDIVGDQTEWAMDCSQWVQAVTMNAMIDTMGEAEFDRVMKLRGDFHFRVQNSTANWRAVGWERERSKDLFTRVTATNTGVPEERSESELLKISPSGTRVAISTDFRDIVKKSKQPQWRNENSVKIGQNKYAAFGFDTKTPMSIRRLADIYAIKVAKIIDKDLSEVRRTIFVQSIEQFQRP